MSLIRTSPALLLAGAILAGCTPTTLRTNSLERVRMEGRDIVVSSIWAEDDQVDFVVYEDPLWSGYPMPDQPRLSRALASRAAEDVMAWRCWGGGFHPVGGAATSGDDRYTFRYACGAQPGGKTP